MQDSERHSQRRRRAGPLDAPGATGAPARGVAEAWRLAAALAAAPTVQAQLDLLLEAAPRVVGAHGTTATIYLRDDLAGSPRAIARYGYQPTPSGAPRPQGLTIRILASGQARVVQDTAADPEVNPVVRRVGIRSFVGLPLLVQRRTEDTEDTEDTEHAEGSEADVSESPAGARGAGLEAIGVLYVNARRRRVFGPRTVAALEGLASLAAATIQNGYLIQAQRDTTARLTDALRLREQFASAASHELKTPLTPLKGYGQALLRRLDQAAASGRPFDLDWARRAVGIMLDQVDRLDVLIGDLLDVSRLRSGRFTIEPVALDLVELAQRVFQRFDDALAAEREMTQPEVTHTLRLRREADTLPGEWDPNRLDQLLTNLLTNAVKYSPQGGTVELVVAPVVEQEGRGGAGLRAWRPHAPAAGAGWVHLAVRDQGIGLPAGAAERERLFEPFTRGQNAPGEHFTGFGLGLYICAEIVRRHGGTIWAESNARRRGSTFHVLLPPSPPPADA